MVYRYFLSTLFIASILIVSCRQDDSDILKENITITKNDAVQIKKGTAPENENSVISRDSLSTVLNSVDPPKNGTHWKIDSLLQTMEDYDPPKNGTHWKAKD